MSTNYNPKIVKDGLVLCLDAANSKSYPGSGTTWTDLSGNGNNGTLTNGPTYNSNNLGSINFDGANDYIGSFPNSISDTGSKTVSMFFNISKTSRAGLCGTRSSSGTDGWALTVNRTSAGNITYYYTGGSTFELSASIQNNQWYNIAITHDTSSATAKFYINGELLDEYTSFVIVAESLFNGVIGYESEQLGQSFSGKIGITQIYNRALSADEIAQNFNAQRGRYGI